MTDQIQAQQAVLDTLVAQVPTIQASIQSLQATVASLKNSPTSTISPDDQTSLNKSDADLAALSTAFTAIAAALAPPTSQVAAAADPAAK